MADFAGSTTSLVADVDCTTEGKSLCEKFSISGYPSIKYGDPADMKDYDGARSYDGLKKFADENLGPSCGVDHLDLCKEDDKALIEKFLAMSKEDLEKAISEADDKIKKLEDKAAEAVGKLEAKIEKANQDKEKEENKQKASLKKEKKKIGLGVMHSVYAARKKKEEL